jgi:hypothetical protein
MALASEKVRAEVVDGDEFPEFARKYNVSGVPKTLINYQNNFLGAAPEAFVLERIQAAP